MLYDWFGECNGYGYPETDLHTINLDWILCELSKIKTDIEYIKKNYVKKSGDIMTGALTLSISDNKKILLDPVLNRLSFVGGGMVQHLEDPVDPYDAVNKKYVDTH